MNVLDKLFGKVYSIDEYQWPKKDTLHDVLIEMGKAIQKIMKHTPPAPVMLGCLRNSWEKEE